MKYFRALLMFFAMLMVMPAFAEEPVPTKTVVDVNSMTPEQVDLLRKQVQNYNGTTEKSVPKQLNEWADLGKNIGAGLVGAAREMGVAANEFSQTTIGKTVIVMLVWKFFGKSVVLFMMLFMIPFVIAPLVLKGLRSFICECDTSVEPRSLFGFIKYDTIVRKYRYEDGYQVIAVLSMVVCAVLWGACLVNL